MNLVLDWAQEKANKAKSVTNRELEDTIYVVIIKSYSFVN